MRFASGFLPTGSSTISMACMRPIPRTSPIQACSCWSASRPARSSAPRASALAGTSSSTIVSSVAHMAAMQIGLPPNVEMVFALPGRGDLVGGDRGAHGEAFGDALGHDHDVGLHAPVLDAEPRVARAAEARLHLVDDQQAAEAADDLGHALEVAPRRHDVAAHAQDGLGDERGRAGRWWRSGSPPPRPARTSRRTCRRTAASNGQRYAYGASAWCMPGDRRVRAAATRRAR